MVFSYEVDVSDPDRPGHARIWSSCRLEPVVEWLDEETMRVDRPAVPRSKQSPVGALALLLLAVSLGACCPPVPPAWWGEYSPDLSQVVTIAVDMGGIGGSTWNVFLYPTIDQYSFDMEEGHLLYEIHGCNVLYVFWLAADRLEIVLSPTNKACTLDMGQLHPVEGLEVLISLPRDTTKAEIMGTTPELLPGEEAAAHDGSVPPSRESRGE